jgi:hypothetical protein
MRRWLERTPLKNLIGGPARLPLETYLRARPIRNPAVETRLFEGGARLVAPLQTQGTGLMGRIAKWAKMPETKEFELEEVGAYVWNLCDGEHATETIGKKLRREFQMDRLEAETALAAFLETLARRRLILLAAPQDSGKTGRKNEPNKKRA